MNLSPTLSASTDTDDGTVAVFADDNTIVVSVDNQHVGASAYLSIGDALALVAELTDAINAAGL